MNHLLHLNGEDLKNRPLRERRDLLEGILGNSGVLLSQSLPVAKIEDRGADITMTEDIVGSPNYMAPRENVVRPGFFLLFFRFY